MGGEPIKSLSELSKALPNQSAKLSCYVCSSDKEKEWAVVIAYGADDAVSLLRENGVTWQPDDKSVSVRRAQRNVDDDRQLIWFGYRTDGVKE